MPTMTRWQFIRRHQGDAVDTESLKHDTALGPDLSDRMIRADTNADGSIRGRREFSELFSAIDHFDRNGSWHSVSIVPGRGSTTVINALASIERASTPPSRSDTPSELLARFLTQHPDMETHQDMINHCLRAAGGDWARGQAIAKSLGLNLNTLVLERTAPLRSAGRAEHPEQPEPQSTGSRSSTVSSPPVRIPSGVFGDVFRRHELHLSTLESSTARVAPGELRHFEKTWRTHRARYERVSQRTNVPAPLIAAIHYRESSSNFETYLHQGDPLGYPPVHHPRNIPTFYSWEEAAAHALESKGWLRNQLGMSADTRDLRSMATYAEAYNGLGYFNRGLTSPYVYAGTRVYTGGRYVADGVFDSNSWDTRPGVVALIRLTESVV